MFFKIPCNIFSTFPFFKCSQDRNLIQFSHEQCEILLNKDNIKPTEEFERIIEDALNGMNPLKDLQDMTNM